jgi:hypothetical protein
MSPRAETTNNITEEDGEESDVTEDKVDQKLTTLLEDKYELLELIETANSEHEIA